MNAIGSATAWKILNDRFGLEKTVDRDSRHDKPFDSSSNCCRIYRITIRIEFSCVEMAVSVDQHD